MYISKCDNSKSSEIATLWNDGKSLGEISNILDIELTYRNAATGENIPRDDFSRCINNGLFEHNQGR